MKGDLSYFFDIALDLMCIGNKAGYFVRVNPAFTKTLGYSTEEILSKPFVGFVHPGDRLATLAELKKLYTGINTVCFENRFQCKDGSWKWLSWTCPGADENGLLYATARDITQQKADMAFRENLIQELRDALEQVKTLEGIIPICTYCKKIRDDKGFWDRVENYISQRTDAKFSHGMCPKCAVRYFPDIFPDDSDSESTVD